MFPRIREISDPFGSVLRLSVEPHPSGALILLERPGRKTGRYAMLDLYGSEVLAAFLHSAKLIAPEPMHPEEVEGEFPTRFSLSQERVTRVLLDQLGMGDEFPIDAVFWQRLLAELHIVNAHARELARRRFNKKQ